MASSNYLSLYLALNEMSAKELFKFNEKEDKEYINSLNKNHENNQKRQYAAAV